MAHVKSKENKMYVLNVWFGADTVASVSLTFSNLSDAIAEAERYDGDWEKPVVFGPKGEQLFGGDSLFE